MKHHLPINKPGPVVRPGEFIFAAAFLDHSHIYGQCMGLVEAGGELRWVYDPDPDRVKKFREKFPQVCAARAFDEILADPAVQLVAAAAVTSERGPLGCRVLRAGKDYFTDKAPFTTIGQLAEARQAVAVTGRKYLVYYSERLHVESAMFAGDLVRAGMIGRIVHVTGFGPHRLNKAARPDWFFERARYGGILCDIGSHQFEQFLSYAGATNARVAHAATGKGEQHLAVAGLVGFRFFGEMIRDCLERTERAMTQAHAFKAAELCLLAQQAAQQLTPAATTAGLSPATGSAGLPIVAR